MFGLMGLTLGLSVLLTGSTSTAIIPGPVTKMLLGQFIGGMFAVLIIWWAIIVVAFYYLLHISPVGNWIFALGGDKVSARNAGIPTERLTISLFMMSGFCAAFVGMSQAIVYTSAQVATGQSFIFNSIMCVVIGGVLLTGGFGSVLGIVLGTITFSIVNQGIYFTSFDANLGSVIIGALLLLAVMMNDTFRQLALSYSTKKKSEGGAMNDLSIGQYLRRPEIGSVLSLLAVIAFFVIFGGVDLGNLLGAASWVNFAANLGIVALPLGLLMIAGEMDISIGAMIPAGSMTVAIVSGYFELPILVGMLCALGIGVLVGLVNGILTVRTSVPSLIITLGTLVAMQGVVLGGSVLITGSASVALEAPGWSKFLFGQLIADSFQVIIFWWLALTVVYFFVIHRTPYGNWIFAMGGDKVSARNAGIPTKQLTVALFVLSAVSATFVGMCQAILFNSAQVSGGMNYIFNAIVAVVVGGVLLTGGFGSVIGIFFGTADIRGG